MSKPDWKGSPEWAEWLAQDEDGQWGWYEDKPVLGDWSWIWDGGDWKEALAGDRADNWIDTLEKRP